MTDLHQEFERSHLFHKARIDRRSADALLGVTAGLVADGNINQMEAAFLKTAPVGRPGGKHSLSAPCQHVE